ncbi:MinD/ParA family ATP-binding protein [Propionivibrio dicarboxylicus]|uniref:Flagellar biosynthesis protein FlhG n=1 Tax=Propionivibrio dicarboxylicus TaxID=83767 RepID=A0A1G8HGH7_9RHOO|nr:AAA family ATPase [Propionivibrio dicarboxylicus]SDI05580.1 flagellar biosynthesis protein FlhG [Propionivibrio dicarboxylicus]
MADYRGDQADGLRRLFGREQTRVVAFTSGRGGVGKTALVANLGAALASQGRRVLIVDENTQHNVAAFFGMRSRHDLLQVLDEEIGLDEALLGVTPGVRVLPAAKAVKQLGHLDARQQDTLIHSLTGMDQPADVILVDASPDHPLGFSPFGLAAHDTVVVISPSGEDITDAYALIKKVSLGYAHRSFRLLVNKARSAEEAVAIHRNMARLSHGRGVARLSLAGYVPADDAMRQAARLRQAIAVVLPGSPSGRACQTLATELQRWPLPDENAGGLEYFVQQLLHLSQHIDPQPIYA